MPSLFILFFLFFLRIFPHLGHYLVCKISAPLNWVVRTTWQHHQSILLVDLSFGYFLASLRSNDWRLLEIQMHQASLRTSTNNMHQGCPSMGPRVHHFSTNLFLQGLRLLTFLSVAQWLGKRKNKRSILPYHKKSWCHTSMNIAALLKDVCFSFDGPLIQFLSYSRRRNYFWYFTIWCLLLQGWMDDT